MANRRLFRTKGAGVTITTTINKAGGKAYAFGDEHILAQGIVTSCFGQTYYMSESEQLDTILGLAQTCDPTFVAKAAVYGHEVARMKDTPALMLAVLASRAKAEPAAAAAFAAISPRILTRFKMVQNFVQMIRSGKTGRRSFGSLPKRMLRQWFAGRTGNALFTGSIGSDPSMADVIKMIHPCPESAEKKALYAYMIGRPYEFDELPPKVREYEAFKNALVGRDLNICVQTTGTLPFLSVPSVPFQLLASLPLTKEHWKNIILQMPWNSLRMNLNTAARHGALDDPALVEHVAKKLADPEEVRRNSAFPYQLLTTFQNVGDDVPMAIRLALQDAMEVATENVPVFDGGVAVCIDTSGSMVCTPVTGHRAGSTTKTRCVDVAALVGASLARRNPNAVLVPFDHQVHATHSLNPRDSIMTNAAKLAAFGGGATDTAAAMRLLNTLVASRPKVVIYVSDNESWFNPNGSQGMYYRGTGMAHEWDTYKRKTPGAKLINIDLVANGTTQVVDNNDVMNIGGFSDKVWPSIERFVRQGDTDFVRLIQDTITLDTPFKEDAQDGIGDEEV